MFLFELEYYQFVRKFCKLGRLGDCAERQIQVRIRVVPSENSIWARCRCLGNVVQIDFSMFVIIFCMFYFDINKMNV